MFFSFNYDKWNILAFWLIYFLRCHFSVSYRDLPSYVCWKLNFNVTIVFIYIIFCVKPSPLEWVFAAVREAAAWTQTSSITVLAYGQLIHFWSSFPPAVPGRQWKVVQVLGLLPSVWESEMKFLVTGFRLAHSCWCGHVGSEPVNGNCLCCRVCFPWLCVVLPFQ